MFHCGKFRFGRKDTLILNNGEKIKYQGQRDDSEGNSAYSFAAGLGLVLKTRVDSSRLLITPAPGDLCSAQAAPCWVVKL